MANEEVSLGVLIETIAKNTAALDEFQGKINNLQVTTQRHAVAATNAANAERDLSREAGISARAMGEVGARGGEAFERLTNLTTAAGGLQGTLLGLGVLGLGAVVEGFHKVDEAYQANQTSTQSLRQAAEATGQSFENLQTHFEEWGLANKSYVENQNEARDALALFVRAGQDELHALDSLQLALELSVGYHISLAEAAKQVELGQQGMGRGLRQLGIDLKTLKTDDENATQAHKNYEESTKKVTEAQKQLSQAQQELHLREDALKGKHKETAVQADELTAAHKRVDDATKNLQTATDNQHTAQDKLNDSVKIGTQVNKELHDRLDGLQKAQSDQKKATNDLNYEWDKFAKDVGPGVEKALTLITSALGGLIGALDAAYNGMNRLRDAQNALIGSAYNAVTGGGGDVSSGNVPRRRQAGGPVFAGSTYTVGEAGVPEMLTLFPEGGGFVTPSAPTSGGGVDMDDTNEILVAVHQVLVRIDGKLGGSGLSTAAYASRA